MLIFRVCSSALSAFYNKAFIVSAFVRSILTRVALIITGLLCSVVVDKNRCRSDVRGC